MRLCPSHVNHLVNESALSENLWVQTVIRRQTNDNAGPTYGSAKLNREGVAGRAVVAQNPSDSAKIMIDIRISRVDERVLTVVSQLGSSNRPLATFPPVVSSNRMRPRANLLG